MSLIGLGNPLNQMPVKQALAQGHDGLILQLKSLGSTTEGGDSLFSCMVLERTFCR